MSAMGGQPFIAAYCASKGALDTLTRNTAYALLRNRIRVNGLNIGWMASAGENQTQRDYHGRPESWLEEAAAQQPNGRLLDPMEVALGGCVPVLRGIGDDDRRDYQLRPGDLGRLRQHASP